MEPEAEKKRPFATLTNKIFTFAGSFSKLSFSWPKLFLTRLPLIILIFIIFLIGLMTAGFALYWYVPKATVVIFVKPKV